MLASFGCAAVGALLIAFNAELRPIAGLSCCVFPLGAIFGLFAVLDGRNRKLGVLATALNAYPIVGLLAFVAVTRPTV